MRAFHVVTGLPRSGSTLLCNLLNQNPEFHASSTSVLAQTIGTVSHIWSQAPEVTSARLCDADGMDARMVRALRMLIEGWYREAPGVVFDKGRGWTHHALALKQLFPEAKIIVTVRDLRGVFGSVEKQHRKNPLLDTAPGPVAKGIFERADQMFSPQGLIGAPLHGVLDLMRRQPHGIILIQYETLAQAPAMVMERLYAELDETPFQHDFEHVENTATDADALYLGKYPHVGAGKVQPVNRTEWQQFVSSDLAGQIMGRYPLYNQMFGYA